MKEQESLHALYYRFMAEADPDRKNEIGKDLIRVIFGKDAIAEDLAFLASDDLSGNILDSRGQSTDLD